MKIPHTISAVSLCFAVAASMGLAGCGSSGGGGAATPDGIYTGSITGGREINGFNGDEKAIIYEGRTMVFSMPGDIQQLFDGQLTVSGNTLNGEMRIFDNTISVVTALLDVDGEFVSNQSVTLNFTDTDPTPTPIPDGTITLTKDNTLFGRGSDTATINGGWTAITTGFTVSTSLNIDAQGVVTGFDYNDTCTVDGTITAVNPAINVYSVDLVYTNCTSLFDNNGQYTGLGWTEGDADQYFNIIYGNDTFGRAMVLNRM